MSEKSKRAKLEQLIDHHLSHEVNFEHVPRDNRSKFPMVFISLPEKRNISYSNWESRFGSVNPPGWGNVPSTVHPDKFVEESEYFEREDSMSDLTFIEQPDTATAVSAIESVLDECGLAFDDINSAIEVNCPGGGRTTWNDFDDSKVSKFTQEVNSGEKMLREAFAKAREIAAGCDSNFPPIIPINLFAGETQLPYGIGPGVHFYRAKMFETTEEFEESDEPENIAKFISILKRFDVAHIDQGISGATVHVGDLSPVYGVEICHAVFDGLLDVGIEDLTFAELENDDATHRYEVVTKPS